MGHLMDRRRALKSMSVLAAGCGVSEWLPRDAAAATYTPAWTRAIDRGLQWMVRNQSPRGRWMAGTYPTAMTALGGTALIASGSTATQGPYAKNIRRPSIT